MFLSLDINLSAYSVVNDGGPVRVPGLKNHAMSSVFEDLVRRFNEDNNEESAEHWASKDVVQLMAGWNSNPSLTTTNRRLTCFMTDLAAC